MLDKYREITSEEELRLVERFDNTDVKMHKKIVLLSITLLILFFVLLLVLFSHIFSIMPFL